MAKHRGRSAAAAFFILKNSAIRPRGAFNGTPPVPGRLSDPLHPSRTDTPAGHTGLVETLIFPSENMALARLTRREDTSSICAA
jgi:hypothetical protein